MNFEKYKFIGPKVESDQKEINYIEKIKNYKEYINKGPGPTLEDYDNYLEAIEMLIDVDMEEVKESLSVEGSKMDEIRALERFISFVEQGRNPFEHKDGVPNFFKY